MQQCPFAVAIELFEYWSKNDFPPPHFLLRQIAYWLGAREPQRKAGELSKAEQYLAATAPKVPVTSFPDPVRDFLASTNGTATQ